jgi:hypothetical protein
MVPHTHASSQHMQDSVKFSQYKKQFDLKL